MSSRELSSISTVLILTYSKVKDALNKNTSIILGTKRDTGLITAIGGGKLASESLKDSIKREVLEELGDFSNHITYLNPRPISVVVNSRGKDSVGFWYMAASDIPIPNEGLPIQTDEISSLNMYNIEQVKGLLETPQKIYKPDFNVLLLKYFMFYMLHGDPYSYSHNDDIDIAKELGIPEYIYTQIIGES